MVSVKTTFALSLLALCHSAFAVTDIYTGKVNFKGMVENAACAISAGDVTGNTVDLGNVRLAEISGEMAKPAAAKTPFQITLDECDTLVATKASITFTGTTAQGLNTILVGSGNGVGIQIFEKSSTTPMTFGTASTPYTLTDGQTALDFSAGFAATTATPGVGAVSATANFQVSYL